MMMRAAALVVLAATLCWTGRAHAADVPAPGAEEAARAPAVKTEIPILAFTYQAAGVSARSIGAQAYGSGTAAVGHVGLGGAKGGILGGGLTLWGSPIDRLTLIGDAARNQTGNFAPSAAAVVRIFGRADDGFSLGAIGKFKVEGFGVGPKNEMESEIESGLLLSYSKLRWHFDLNAITGFGTGDDGEIDTEGRLRIGRDLGNFVRVGIDGQARYRVSGATALVGNRNGDFMGGPQVLIGGGHFYGALTGGPSTMNITSGIGWAAVAAIGGSTL
jgi:hypothetical protein